MSRTNTSIIDKAIGDRVHELRVSLGLSRMELSRSIGVTHQQLQKYELGTNRLSAGRLVRIAKALGKPVVYFFDGLDSDVPSDDSAPLQHRRMCIEVGRSFLRIRDPRQQKAVNELVRSLADASV